MGRTAGLPYRFEFYLRRKPAGNQPVVTPPSSHDAQHATLERIAVTLPPPVRAGLRSSLTAHLSANVLPTALTLLGCTGSPGVVDQ